MNGCVCEQQDRNELTLWLLEGCPPGLALSVSRSTYRSDFSKIIDFRVQNAIIFANERFFS